MPVSTTVPMSQKQIKKALHNVEGLLSLAAFLFFVILRETRKTTLQGEEDVKPAPVPCTRSMSAPAFRNFSTMPSYPRSI
jgi:hypothetical protein